MFKIEIWYSTWHGWHSPVLWWIGFSRLSLIWSFTMTWLVWCHVVKSNLGEKNLSFKHKHLLFTFTTYFQTLQRVTHTLSIFPQNCPLICQFLAITLPYRVCGTLLCFRTLNLGIYFHDNVKILEYFSWHPWNYGIRHFKTILLANSSDPSISSETFNFRMNFWLKIWGFLDLFFIHSATFHLPHHGN